MCLTSNLAFLGMELNEKANLEHLMVVPLALFKALVAFKIGSC